MYKTYSFFDMTNENTKKTYSFFDKTNTDTRKTYYYSNLTNNYIDPVNASIEIGRRGIFKYIKNNFYPKIDIGTIMDTMIRLNNIKPRDVSYLKDCNNWIEMYRKIQESGLRYRATIEDGQFDYQVVNNLIHSKIKKVCFLKENKSFKKVIN